LARSSQPRGPDELVVRGQRLQPLPDPVGDAVRDAVDQVKASRHLLEGALEAEEADHAVDVDCQYRPF